ncbi:MAG TPA: signal peptidase I [Dictyoglomaceae bacterium]|nr:signal peptidase I [Dictyoglomaceae bacterium]HOL39172.1 signal peptidase I [Dictyoglomaceae bacterium]HOP94218.1 signal peptidase I [Dictyoglomaceae bacterium]HPP15326.1 signal peptidase I [Dictyoglomaceae bacterium]
MKDKVLTFISSILTKREELKKYEWYDLLETIVFAFILALLIKSFILQISYIPTGSMIPTLNEREAVLVVRIPYYFREPTRGEIIVFRYPQDPKTEYVKRLIGLPGDTVEIKSGVVYVNGEALDEPYVKNKSFDDYGPIKVPEDNYFVLGDNRPVSVDSRYWGFVPQKNLIGRAIFLLWPPQRIGTVK